MRVISRGRLREFWLQSGRQDAEEPLQAWFAHAKKASWTNWSEVKADFQKADWVGNDRMVFDILHNKYRLVVKIEFSKKRIYVRFIGTHEQYDDIKDITAI